MHILSLFLTLLTYYNNKLLRNIYEDFEEELYSEIEDEDDFIVLPDEFYDSDIIDIEDEEEYIIEQPIEGKTNQTEETEDLFENLLWTDLEDEELVQKAYEDLMSKEEKTQIQINEIKEKIKESTQEYIILGGEGYKELDEHITELCKQRDSLEERIRGFSGDISFIESVVKFHNAKNE